MITSNLDERKQKILQSIIEDYVATAHPVGSSTICEKHHLKISPATARWEMLELEKEGYVTHPHTSAGRIPTDKGYRYYVDHLMKSQPLSTRDEEFIQEEYDKARLELEELLCKTSKILSAILDYTVLVFSAAWKEKLYTSGISHMLNQPEFKNLQTLKSVLETLEKEEPIIESMKEVDSPEVIVKIGSENKLKQMKHCSMVMKNYGKKDKTCGSLGIMGPTRMDYRKTTNLVDYVSNILNDFMEEVG